MDAPFGMVVYEAMFEHEVFCDLTLRWSNQHAETLTDLKLIDNWDQSLKWVIAPDRWRTLQERFTALVLTGEPFTYAHTSPTGLDYIATVWRSGTLIGIKIREESSDLVEVADVELASALRVLQAQSAKTLEIAQLLDKQSTQCEKARERDRVRALAS